MQARGATQQRTLDIDRTRGRAYPRIPSGDADVPPEACYLALLRAPNLVDLWLNFFYDFHSNVKL